MLADSLHISSKMGNYTVNWCNSADDEYRAIFHKCRVAIVDQNVWNIYGSDKETFGSLENVILQVAEEDLKTAETCISLCEQLLDLGFKRGQVLLAIGGGIVQDLATFSASILYRGIPWVYVPTTLLAQADSCIGGKSSINLGNWKNQIGNFYPPRQIYVVHEYLQSLTDVDIRSGLGEILKVHLLSGPEMVQQIIEDSADLVRDSEVLTEASERALRIKARIIEEDEFDQGRRLILNFGHSFGHALETATKFAIAHGIAVTFGADVASYLAWQLGRISQQDYETMHGILKQNLRPSDWVDFDSADFFKALRHDKKNRPGEYCFILPSSLGTVGPVFVPIERDVEQQIAQYLQGVREWLL